MISFRACAEAGAKRNQTRPFSKFPAWLKFSFFPLLALGALA